MKFYNLLFFLLLMPLFANAIAQSFSDEVAKQEDTEKKKSNQNKVRPTNNAKEKNDNEVKTKEPFSIKKSQKSTSDDMSESNTILRELDEVPFSGSDSNKEHNIFGSKKDKDLILSKMEYQIGFLSEGGVYNNADLRRLNESNQYTINDSDDRTSLAFSRFYIRFYFPITGSLFFHLDLYKNGYWGSDQLGGNSSNNNSATTLRGADPFNFGELYLKYVFLKHSSYKASISLGRQFFEVGGIETDYVLRDYLDAITFNIKASNLGQIRILALDVFQAASDIQGQINYIRYFSNAENRVANFNGDVNVLRHGLVFDSNNILTSTNTSSLKTKVYAFFARYGGVRGGSDRTNQGSNGNFSDNDFSILAGNRWILQIHKVLPSTNIKLFSDFAASSGLDRKSKSNGDATNNGFMASVGGKLVIRSRPIEYSILLESFYATGPSYDSQGKLKSNGFVSFKGNHLGGILLGRYRGVHPSAYTGSDGIELSPYNYERKSGTLFAHLSLRLKYFKRFTTQADGWILQDTGQTNFKVPNSATDKVQLRLNGTIGLELDLLNNFQINKYWSLYLNTAIFIPGEFYDTSYILSQNTPFGTDRFWGVQIGSKLIF